MPNRYALRKVWISIHRWVGLSAGVVLVIIGLTGSISVFWRELAQVFDAQLAVESPDTQYRPYAEMVAAVNAAFPKREHEWFFMLPWYRSGVLYAIDHDPVERAGQYERPLYVAVDPFTAKVTTHYFWGETAVSWLYNLHSHLNAGAFGLTVVGTLGILLLGLALSGIYLWWPITRFSRRQFVPSLQNGAARFEFDLHRVGGFYSAILLVVVSLSGINIVFPDAVNRLVGQFSEPNVPIREEDETPHSTVRAGVAAVPVDAAIQRAREIFPKARLTGFYAPGGAQDAYGIIMQQPTETFDRHYPHTEVWIDQYSGEVLQTVDPTTFNAARRVLTIHVPLHGGEAFGMTGRVLVCIAGLIPLLMFVTGLRQWLRARKRSVAASVAAQAAGQP